MNWKRCGERGFAGDDHVIETEGVWWRQERETRSGAVAIPLGVTGKTGDQGRGAH